MSWLTASQKIIRFFIPLWVLSCVAGQINRDILRHHFGVFTVHAAHVSLISEYYYMSTVRWKALTAILARWGRLDWPCCTISDIVVFLLLSFHCLPPSPHKHTHEHVHIACPTPSESHSVYSGACSLGAVMNSYADFNTPLPLRQMPKQILS